MIELICGRHMVTLWEGEFHWKSEDLDIEFGKPRGGGAITELTMFVDHHYTSPKKLRIWRESYQSNPKFVPWGRDRLLIVIDEELMVMDLNEQVILSQFTLNAPIITVLFPKEKIVVISEFGILLIGESLEILDEDGVNGIVFDFELSEQNVLTVSFDDGEPVIMDCS